MAIISSIILGRAKGSIGGVSLSTQKGRVIARQKPTIVANPNTDKQQKQRGAMQSIVGRWGLVSNLVKSGITKRKGYGSEFNAFVSANMAVAQEFPYADQTIKAFHLNNHKLSLGAGPELHYQFIQDPNNKGIVRLENDSLNSLEFKKGRLVVISAYYNSPEFIRKEKEVDFSADILQEAYILDLDIDHPQVNNKAVAVWFESEDGKFSTTSVLRLF